jgi:hypothetical protein
MKIIAAIDPGIKNLGICIADISGADIQNILLWENFNLVSETSAQKATRCSCGGPASWLADLSGNQWHVCKKCAKKGFKGLQTLDSAVLASVGSVREFTAGLGWEKVKSRSKASLIEELQRFYMLPYKEPKVKSLSPDDMYRKLEQFVKTRIQTLRLASVIRIENQKSEAPALRDIQMQIYVLMRYMLENEHGWKGTFEFVHPGQKNKADNIAAGSDQYKDRKDATLARITKKLEEWSAKSPALAKPMMDMLASTHKKYDMTDTLMMITG